MWQSASATDVKPPIVGQEATVLTGVGPMSKPSENSVTPHAHPITRFFSIGYKLLPTALHPVAERFEKFGDAALGRSALAMRPSCPP